MFSGPTCVTFTFGVEERKQLSAQLSVGHRLFEKGVLFCQLLGAEVLCLSCHPVVVVQQCQQSSIGGSGEQNLLVQVSEQAGGHKNRCRIKNEIDNKTNLLEKKVPHSLGDRSDWEPVSESGTRACGSTMSSEVEALLESRA